MGGAHEVAAGGAKLSNVDTEVPRSGTPDFRLNVLPDTTFNLPTRRSREESQDCIVAKRQRQTDILQISTNMSLCQTRVAAGGAILAYSKRITFRSNDLLQKMPANRFAVAFDVAEDGRKQFTYFQSPEDFFRETTGMVNRNFYEIIRRDQPCCL